MSKELHELVLDDLKARTSWELRQSTWYAMRHNGLRRKNKPFPGASDLHFPLSDSMIEKLKPFYFQQVYATETVATFITKPDAPQGVGNAELTALGQWFDYKLKAKSNFERELLIAIDKMCQGGKELIRIAWNPKKKALQFDAIDPLFVIVPSYTQQLDTADRITHVTTLSQFQYENGDFSGNYNKDKAFIKRITGRQNAGAAEMYKQDKIVREGITQAEDDKQIVIWTTYERTASGITVHNFSPLCPDEPIRPDFGLPYLHGQMPFIAFDYETKDKGHYDPRGVTEIVAPFETSLCKQWNEKHDYMSFCNRPVFSSEREIPNASNIRMMPGQILPFGVQAVNMPQPPISHDQEMTNTRMIAEYRVGMPDFGQGQNINTNERRTATEVQSISNLMSQGVDLRARVFRRSLTDLYKQAWGLLVQYDKDAYFINESQSNQLKDGLLTDQYEIQPNGSNDAWNRQLRLQKAALRMTQFNGNPKVNQTELIKSVLELDDPKLVSRLMIPDEEIGKGDYENEAALLPAILLGAPLSSHPEFDQAVRVKCLVEFQLHRQQSGNPLSPEETRNIAARIQMHGQALAQKDPAAAKALAAQVRAAMQQSVQTSQAQAAEAQAQVPIQ